MIPLIWSLQAKEQRNAFLEYIARDNVDAAFRLNERFDEVAGMLRQYPEMGKAGRVSGTREMRVHPNYILIYRVHKHTVEILQVIHCAQNYPT